MPARLTVGFVSSMLLIVLVAGPAAAAAPDAQCSGDLTAVTVRNVTVPDGETCVLRNSTVTGGVSVSAGSYFQSIRTPDRGRRRGRRRSNPLRRCRLQRPWQRARQSGGAGLSVCQSRGKEREGRACHRPGLHLRVDGRARQHPGDTERQGHRDRGPAVRWVRGQHGAAGQHECPLEQDGRSTGDSRQPLSKWRPDRGRQHGAIPQDRPRQLRRQAHRLRGERRPVQGVAEPPLEKRGLHPVIAGRYGQLVPAAISGSVQTSGSSRPRRQKPMPSPRSRASRTRRPIVAASGYHTS